MGHYRVVVVQILFFPYRFKQLFRGNDSAAVAAEVPQDAEFDGSQGQLLSVQEAFMAVLCNVQPTDIQLLYLAAFGICGVIAGISAQLGFYPGHKLQGIKGVGDASSAPRVSPVILSISSTRAVSMIIGKRWDSRIFWHRVKPSISGSITSRMARLKSSCSTQRRASDAR